MKAAIIDLEELGPDAYLELVEVAEASWFKLCATTWEGHAGTFRSTEWFQRVS